MWRPLLQVIFYVSLVDGREAPWKCPYLYEDDSISCICDIPHTVRCSGVVSPNDVYPISVIAQRLRQLGPGEQVSLLDLSIQGVEALRNFDFENITLQGLVLSSGILEFVPESAFSKMSDSLRALGLPGNRLVKIPVDAIEKLVRLERLDLSGNSITTIPPRVFSKLKSLNYLDLSKNKIRSFQAQSFYYLKNLKTLALDDNQISLPQLESANFKGLLALETLSLKGNDISGRLGPNFLSGIPSLTTLDLSNNNLTSLERGFCEYLSNLRQLILKRNLIDVIEDNSFIRVSHLLHLDLSYNRIVTASVHSFSHLKYLRTLDMSHNYLRVISRDILSGLSSLTELYLQDNDISIVQDGALDSTHNLKKVNFADNPLHCDCRIVNFLNWLVNDVKVMKSDKETAVCTTPPSLENGVLYQIQPSDITCEDDDSYSKNYDERHSLASLDILSSSNIVSKDIVLNKKETILNWEVSKGIIPYHCSYLFIYRQTDAKDVLENSFPIFCNSENSTNPTNLRLSLTDVVLHDNQSYRFCITLVQTSVKNTTPLSGCTEPSLYRLNLPNSLDDNSKLQDSLNRSQSTVITNYNPQMPLLTAFFANVTLEDKLSVYLRVSYNEENCKLNLKVFTDLELTVSDLVNCSVLNYTFNALQVHKERDYKVCGSFLPNLTSESPVLAHVVEDQCVQVLMSQGALTLSTLILTILLSILFFVVSLILLLLIYYVTKKVMSPQNCSLTIPSGLARIPNNYLSWVKRGIENSHQDMHIRA